MEKEIVSRLKKTFEDYAQNANGLEFWFARDLQDLLDYNDWRNFVNVIDKAKTACQNSGQQINEHLVDVNKMIARFDDGLIFCFPQSPKICMFQSLFSGNLSIKSIVFSNFMKKHAFFIRKLYEYKAHKPQRINKYWQGTENYINLS